ncbi:MFS transporter [Rugosimonospora africana]|uniref:MFS transporter n=1 Tax=Rugosimonospora africana TaxID=556532 RepID=A0A8J3VQG2_9ACTN|nr:MFS transporter [Rugosimonospora africana]GIH14293.1 MFS transporter [Rugosimonospora africana]
MATVSVARPTRERTSWLPLVGIVLAVFMLMLDATVVTVALPAMARDLNGNLTDLQWVMNAYTVAMAAVQLTAGAMADRYGRRRLFLIGVACFALASLACGLATTVTLLVAARAVQGLAGAVMFATTLALIGQSYTGAARGTAFAVRGTVAGIAVVLGPVVGGLLTDGLGWRWIFFVNLPVAAAATGIGWWKLSRHEERVRGGRIDIAGPVLMATALVALVYALLRANDEGWTDRLILGCFTTAGLALAGFFLVESRLAHPMLDLRLFTDRGFVGTQIGSFAVQASVFGLFVYLSVYFQDQLGDSVITAGLSFLPIVIPIMITGAAVGAVLDRMPPRLAVGSALGLIGVGVYLMHGVTSHTGWGHLVTGMIVAGAGCGVALPALGSLAVDVPPARVGVASGVNNTALQVGFALGIAIDGAILGTFPRTGAGFADGLNHLITFGACTALAGAAIAAALLPRGRVSRETTASPLVQRDPDH